MTKTAVDATEGKDGSDGQEMTTPAKQVHRQCYDGDGNDDDDDHK